MTSGLLPTSRYLPGDPDLEVIDRRLCFYGAAAELLACEAKEVLAESGAGTGKSFSILAKANYTARQYPGSRQLFCMATRVAMNTTILPDWEGHILWPQHPAIVGTGGPERREFYRYPNGSEISLVGMDRPDKILSSKYDRIYVFQAEQVTKDAWEKLLTRLRGTATPYRQQVADVNPVSRYHWLNLRGDQTICLMCGELGSTSDLSARCSKHRLVLQPIMRRIHYRHQDNPLLFDHAARDWTTFGVEYIQETLGRLTGVDRARLLEHQWISQEGLVLDTFDIGTHVIQGRLTPHRMGGYLLDVFGWDEPVYLTWFSAGVDWGFSQDPGVISVWGHDREGRMFRVAETYRLGWQIDQWAKVAEDYYKRFGIAFFACDPSRPDLIEMLNLRLGKRGGRNAPAIAVKANNSLTKKLGMGKDMTGLDLLRWALRSQSDNKVRMYFVAGSLDHGADPELLRQGRPICTEQEVPSYTLMKMEDGKANKDKPDPACDDHGIDSARYNLSESWSRSLERLGGQMVRPGSMAAVLHHGAQKKARK